MFSQVDVKHNDVARDKSQIVKSISQINQSIREINDVLDGGVSAAKKHYVSLRDGDHLKNEIEKLKQNTNANGKIALDQIAAAFIPCKSLLLLQQDKLLGLAEQTDKIIDLLTELVKVRSNFNYRELKKIVDIKAQFLEFRNQIVKAMELHLDLDMDITTRRKGLLYALLKKIENVSDQHNASSVLKLSNIEELIDEPLKEEKTNLKKPEDKKNKNDAAVTGYFKGYLNWPTWYNDNNQPTSIDEKYVALYRGYENYIYQHSTYTELAYFYLKRTKNTTVYKFDEFVKATFVNKNYKPINPKQTMRFDMQLFLQEMEAFSHGYPNIKFVFIQPDMIEELHRQIDSYKEAGQTEIISKEQVDSVRKYEELYKDQDKKTQIKHADVAVDVAKIKTTIEYRAEHRGLLAAQGKYAGISSNMLYCMQEKLSDFRRYIDMAKREFLNPTEFDLKMIGSLNENLNYLSSEDKNHIKYCFSEFEKLISAEEAEIAKAMLLHIEFAIDHNPGLQKKLANKEYNDEVVDDDVLYAAWLEKNPGTDKEVKTLENLKNMPKHPVKKWPTLTTILIKFFRGYIAEKGKPLVSDDQIKKLNGYFNKSVEEEMDDFELMDSLNKSILSFYDEENQLSASIVVVPNKKEDDQIKKYAVSYLDKKYHQQFEDIVRDSLRLSLTSLDKPDINSILESAYRKIAEMRIREALSKIDLGSEINEKNFDPGSIALMRRRESIVCMAMNDAVFSRNEKSLVDYDEICKAAVARSREFLMTNQEIFEQIIKEHQIKNIDEFNVDVLEYATQKYISYLEKGMKVDGDLTRQCRLNGLSKAIIMYRRDHTAKPHYINQDVYSSLFIKLFNDNQKILPQDLLSTVIVNSVGKDAYKNIDKIIMDLANSIPKMSSDVKTDIAIKNAYLRNISDLLSLDFSLNMLTEEIKNSQLINAALEIYLEKSHFTFYTNEKDLFIKFFNKAIKNEKINSDNIQEIVNLTFIKTKSAFFDERLTQTSDDTEFNRVFFKLIEKCDRRLLITPLADKRLFQKLSASTERFIKFKNELIIKLIEDPELSKIMENNITKLAKHSTRLVDYKKLILQINELKQSKPPYPLLDSVIDINFLNQIIDDIVNVVKGNVLNQVATSIGIFKGNNLEDWCDKFQKSYQKRFGPLMDAQETTQDILASKVVEWVKVNSSSPARQIVAYTGSDPDNDLIENKNMRKKTKKKVGSHVVFKIPGEGGKSEDASKTEPLNSTSKSNKN